MRTRITAKTVNDAIDMALVKFDTTIDEIGYDVIQEASKGFLGIGSKQAIVDIWTLDEEKEAEEKPVNEAKKEEKPIVNKAKEEEKPVVKVKEEEKPKPMEKAKPEKKPKAEKAKEEEKPDTADLSAQQHETGSQKVVADPTDAAKKFLEEVFGNMGIAVEMETRFHDRHLDINLKGEDMGVIIGKRGQTLDSLQYLVSLVVNKAETAYVGVSIDTEGYRQRRKDTLEKLAFNLAKKSKHFRKPISLEPMSPYERRIIHATLQGDRYVTTHSEGEEPYRYVVISPKQYYR